GSSASFVTVPICRPLIAGTSGNSDTPSQNARRSAKCIERWKEVKDFWHLVCLAQRRLPGKSRRLARRLDRLSELLGRDHDHAVLAEKLALSIRGDGLLMRQLCLVAERRRALEAEAFDLGARVYWRRPRAFGRRVHLA
ncbi:MAG: hypothetical protein WD036_07965, partial [Bauldia sp.]